MDLKDITRVSTGIKLLDEGLEGGIPKGNWVVITGEPGTGKSILCMHYAYAGLLSGDPVIYVTTEAEFRDVIRQARQFNMNLDDFSTYYLGDEKPERQPQLVVIDIFSLLKTAKQLSAEAEELERKRRYAALEIETLIAAINEGYRVLGLTDEKHKSPLRHVRLVIDSISAFWADKPAMARKYSYQLKIATHRENVTALLVSQYAMTTKSVYGDSRVSVKVGGSVYEVTIEDLFNDLLRSGNKLVRTKDHDIVSVDGIYTLSLNLNDLTINWCDVYAVVRHRSSSYLYEVILDDGSSLKVTEDHSLFTLDNGVVGVVRAGDLRVGDYVLIADVGNLKTTHYGVGVLRRVSDVRFIGVGDGYVYDLSVEPYENYVANNVVVHNSTFGFGLEHIADGIFHLWLDNVEDVKEVRRYLIIKKMRMTNHYRGAYKVDVVPGKGLVLTKLQV
ncbi:MAG: ATPase domain-containing protein [Sulfolobales archaeon]